VRLDISISTVTFLEGDSLISEKDGLKGTKFDYTPGRSVRGVKLYQQRCKRFQEVSGTGQELKSN
jgi:hypothetical protein